MCFYLSALVGRATSVRLAAAGPGAVLAAIAALALPAGAAADELVPPGNSAVDQYTETYPGAGGDRTTRGAESGDPARVLGPRKARRLEAQGPAGEATAALVAATAPATLAAAGQEASSGTGGGERGAGSTPGADTGRDSGLHVPHPAGPSGPSEVLGQATGLSTTGALLTLAILLTAAWALAYLWRRRRTAA